MTGFSERERTLDDLMVKVSDILGRNSGKGDDGEEETIDFIHDQGTRDRVTIRKPQPPQSPAPSKASRGSQASQGLSSKVAVMILKDKRVRELLDPEVKKMLARLIMNDSEMKEKLAPKLKERFAPRVRQLRPGGGHVYLSSMLVDDCVELSYDACSLIA
ncbi:MAG: hypothetical protein RDV48_14970 [Candidatus Eremiobacteraeota bacterium]|nr:hypothetical protein [Candidatus Eremiobacteraeota bacterium]